MRAFQRLAFSIGLAGTLAMATGRLLALEAFPVITNPNNNGLAFSRVSNGFPNIFADAPFAVDDTAIVNGNDFIVYSLDGLADSVGGGFSVGISNGENGIGMSLDGLDNSEVNHDVLNRTPVNQALATVNAGGVNDGRLNNGNSFRFSAWYRLDPNDSANTNALFKAPQVEPVMKFTFWKEGLSSDADNNGGIQPLFGDRVFDQDQQGGPGGLNIDDMDQTQWIDVDNNGEVADGDAAFEDRMSALSTQEWTLVESTYTVDDDPAVGDWIGIDDDYYAAGDIEEIRAVMFWGDFLGESDLSDAGSFWVDNILLEVFATEADLLATPNPNPMPLEVTTITGDMDGDGQVNFGDLSPFVLGLTDIPGYESAFPDVDRVVAGDASMDGAFNFGDLSPFVDLLTSGNAGGQGAVPEPTSVLLLMASALTLIGCVRRR